MIERKNPTSFLFHRLMRLSLCVIIMLCLSIECLAGDDTAEEDIPAKTGEIDAILSEMTTQEKVAQLFIISPEALTGVHGVTAAGSITEEAFSAYPVGGIIYMEPNILSWDQTSQMLSAIQEISLNRIGLPLFLAVDEEGGRVCRVSGRLENVPYIPEMSSIGSAGDPSLASETGRTIGKYLNQLGFNVDFAPVADVLTNPENTVIGNRSFGSDPILAADMVSQEVEGLREQGICATLKHFPGHGNTEEDSHQGLAVSYKTLEELKSCELLPFESGIAAGADFIMAGHIVMPNITGDNVPASLSYKMLTEILRDNLGYNGIIITDALNMGAIVNSYDSGEAALEAFQAGADMLLMPGDFPAAYSVMLEAVESEKISNERLEASLRRIVSLKLVMNGIHTSGEIPKNNEQQDNQEIPTIPYSQNNIVVETGFDGFISEG